MHAQEWCQHELWGSWATDVQPLSFLLPLEESSGQGLSLLLIRFLARSLFCWRLASGLYPKFTLCWIIVVLCFIYYFQFPQHSSLSKCQGCSLRFSQQIDYGKSGPGAHWSPQGITWASLRAENLKASWISLLEPEIAKKCGLARLTPKHEGGQGPSLMGRGALINK